MILPLSTTIQTILRSLVGLRPFFLKVCDISHLMILISTSKTSIYTGKTLTQLLLPSTSRPLKSRASSTPSLRIWVGHPMISHNGWILIVKPILKLRLTWIIWPIPLPLSIHLYKLGHLNFFGIHHKSRDIHIMMDHCRTILFIYKTRHWYAQTYVSNKK